MLANKLRQRLERLRTDADPIIVLVTDAPGPRALHDSLFLPAVARRRFQDLFAGGSLRVDVELPPPQPLRPRLLAVDVAHRQHRRETWEQKFQRYALPKDTRIHLVVEGVPDLKRVIGGQPPAPNHIDLVA